MSLILPGVDCINMMRCKWMPLGCSWIFLTTSKRCVRKVLLPPYVFRGFKCVQSCEAVSLSCCLFWLLRRCMMILYCRGRDGLYFTAVGAHYRPAWKPASDSFMDPCEGSLQTKANWGLFGRRKRMAVMPKVLNVHIVCLQILGEISVVITLESNNLQIQRHPQCESMCVCSISLFYNPIFIINVS